MVGLFDCKNVRAKLKHAEGGGGGGEGHEKSDERYLKGRGGEGEEGVRRKWGEGGRGGGGHRFQSAFVKLGSMIPQTAATKIHQKTLRKWRPNRRAMPTKSCELRTLSAAGAITARSPPPNKQNANWIE